MVLLLLEYVLAASRDGTHVRAITDALYTALRGGHYPCDSPQYIITVKSSRYSLRGGAWADFVNSDEKSALGHVLSNGRPEATMLLLEAGGHGEFRASWE